MNNIRDTSSREDLKQQQQQQQLNWEAHLTRTKTDFRE